MHWPVPLPPTLENYPHLPSGDRHILPESEWSYLDTWKEMEKVYKKGLCKGIGVSNMSIKYLERISQECEVIPAVNQVKIPFSLLRGYLSLVLTFNKSHFFCCSVLRSLWDFCSF